MPVSVSAVHSSGGSRFLNPENRFPCSTRGSTRTQRSGVSVPPRLWGAGAGRGWVRVDPFSFPSGHGSVAGRSGVSVFSGRRPLGLGSFTCLLVSRLSKGVARGTCVLLHVPRLVRRVLSGSRHAKRPACSCPPRVTRAGVRGETPLGGDICCARGQGHRRRKWTRWGMGASHSLTPPPCPSCLPWATCLQSAGHAGQWQGRSFAHSGILPMLPPTCYPALSSSPSAPNPTPSFPCP